MQSANWINYQNIHSSLKWLGVGRSNITRSNRKIENFFLHIFLQEMRNVSFDLVKFDLVKFDLVKFDLVTRCLWCSTKKRKQFLLDFRCLFNLIRLIKFFRTGTNCLHLDKVSWSMYIVIPNYSTFRYSNTRWFFFKDPGYPGDSNWPKKLEGKTYKRSFFCSTSLNLLKIVFCLLPSCFKLLNIF